MILGMGPTPEVSAYWEAAFADPGRTKGPIHLVEKLSPSAVPMARLPYGQSLGTVCWTFFEMKMLLLYSGIWQYNQFGKTWPGTAKDTKDLSRELITLSPLP